MTATVPAAPAGANPEATATGTANVTAMNVATATGNGTETGMLRTEIGAGEAGAPWLAERARVPRDAAMIGKGRETEPEPRLPLWRMKRRMTTGREPRRMSTKREIFLLQVLEKASP